MHSFWNIQEPSKDGSFFVDICEIATTGWGFQVVEQNSLQKMLGNACCFVELYCFLRHGVGFCEKITFCVQIANNPNTHVVGGLTLEN